MSQFPLYLSSFPHSDEENIAYSDWIINDDVISLVTFLRNHLLSFENLISNVDGRCPRPKLGRPSIPIFILRTHVPCFIISRIYLSG